MAATIYKNKAGKRVKSVTGIISFNCGWNKRPLMLWANKIGLEGRTVAEGSEPAAEAGTIAHYLIECDILDKQPVLKDFPPELLSKAMQSYDNYLEWRKGFGFVPVRTEVELVSEIYQYGGKLDCVGNVRGKLAIVDWKSSAGVYPDYIMQVAAYENLWNENFPDNKITGGIYLLRVDKETAAYTHHWWQDVTKGLEAFKLLLALSEYEKPLSRMA